MLTLEEQELHISAGRTEDTATAYCSDSMWITKFDKLVEKSPELFKVVAQNDVSKTYEFPKRLITIRSCERISHMTDEQRQAAAERIKALNEKKKS